MGRNRIDSQSLFRTVDSQIEGRRAINHPPFQRRSRHGRLSVSSPSDSSYLMSPPNWPSMPRLKLTGFIVAIIGLFVSLNSNTIEGAWPGLVLAGIGLLITVANQPRHLRSQRRLPSERCRRHRDRTASWSHNCVAGCTLWTNDFSSHSGGCTI